MTFYRHFRSKDDLIAAYLRGRLQRDQEQLAELRGEHVGDPSAVLHGIVETLAEDTKAPGFRGCPYANLAAEYCDQDYPARGIAAEHRTWLLREVEALLERSRRLPPERGRRTARHAPRRGDGRGLRGQAPEHVADAFVDAWQGLIDRHR